MIQMKSIAKIIPANISSKPNNWLSTFLNKMLKGEIDQLKKLLKEYEKEIQFYREESATLRKEKDRMRAQMENFVMKNSSIEE